MCVCVCVYVYVGLELTRRSAWTNLAQGAGETSSIDN